MNLKSVWKGSLSYKGAVLVALVSLVVGLGISGSLKPGGGGRGPSHRYALVQPVA